MAKGSPGLRLMRGAVVAQGAGVVEFGQRPAVWASGLQGPEGWPATATVIRVPARPIGMLPARFRPTAICCEIEGGDLGVLAQPLPDVRLVVVETHPAVHGTAGLARVGAGLVAQGFAVEPGRARGDPLVFRR